MISIASTNGVQLALHPFGGSGPGMLFVHGTGLNGPMFGPLAALTKATSWSLDLRGHGYSTPPETDDYAWQGFGDDVVAAARWITAQTGESPVGFGHSLGGASVLRAEAQNPGLFRAVVTFEPIVFPPGAGFPDIKTHPLVQASLRRRAEFASFEAVYDNFRAKPPMNVLDPAALRAYVEAGFRPTDAGTVTLSCPPEREAAVFASDTKHDTWELLDHIHCPLLILHGRVHDAGPARYIASVAERMPTSTVVGFPDLGHFGPFERPDLIAEPLNDVLRVHNDV